MFIHTLLITLLLSSSAFAESYEGVDCLDLWDDQTRYQECINDQDSFNIDGIAKTIEDFFKGLASSGDDTATTSDSSSTRVSKTAVAPLVNTALFSNDPQLRKDAVSSLAELDEYDAEIHDALKRGLSHSSGTVRQRARQAMIDLDY